MKKSILYLAALLLSLILYTDVNGSLGEFNTDKNESINFYTIECSDLNKFSSEYLLIDYVTIKKSISSNSTLCWEGGDGSEACYYVGGCWGGDSFCSSVCETQDGCTVCHICTYPEPSPIEN